MKNWKTTALGISTILAAIAGVIQATLDNDPTTNADVTVAVAAIMSGLGLIFARDAKPGAGEASA